MSRDTNHKPVWDRLYAVLAERNAVTATAANMRLDAHNALFRALRSTGDERVSHLRHVNYHTKVARALMRRHRLDNPEAAQ
jgi:hypothetical protein